MLRGDGIGYNSYISELTYLLFLKLANETGADTLLPRGYRWEDLAGYRGPNLLGHYQELLTHLGATAKSPLIRTIYAFPTTLFSHSENLQVVIEGIDKLNWHSLNTDAIGTVYEGLLAKNSEDSRSGAGQYFTPRPLVDCMVQALRPSLGNLIQDPASGTGGFLIRADHFVREQYGDQRYAANPPRYEGMEIERGTHRLCTMNVFLNRMDATIFLGDALTTDGEAMGQADIILANPPFGIRASGHRLGRESIVHSTTNKQLQFVEHIFRSLKAGGRAAVVVPDNVIFDSGAAQRVRRELIEKTRLHTILRLPTGIFYAQNVSTHVLFFDHKETKEPSADFWLYDLRRDMPRLGKRRPLIDSDFEPFLKIFEDLKNGDAKAESERLSRHTSGDFISRPETLLSGRSIGDFPTTQDDYDADLIIRDMISTLASISSELAEIQEVMATNEMEEPISDSNG